MAHVVHSINRPSPELLKQFAKMDAATLYEAAGKQGMMDPEIKPVWQGAKICGPALTVCCHPGDNLMLHKSVTVAQPGDILVADVGAYTRIGVWGEVLTVAAQAQQIAGLVVDGGVRDIDPIAERGFPVFSRSVAIGGATKQEIGTINHPIVIGDVSINPGDIIVGDTDGIVVVPLQQAEEVLAAAQGRRDKEAGMFPRLEAGETTLELLNLSQIMADKGLTEE